MAKILTTGNKKDEKFLRRPTVPFDFSKHKKSEIRQLIREMRNTMQKADGIGLSANQIGLNVKVFVAKVENKFYALFNPEFIQLSKEISEIDEGCLSVPGVFGMVERPAKIAIKGLDANGKAVKIKAWGLLARVFQHEMDHLNGKLFIDRARRVESLKTGV